MNGFNVDAIKHPCCKCEHGNFYTEQGKPAGNACKHPEITKQKGLLYGLYFTYKTAHPKCPLKQATAQNQKGGVGSE